MQNSPFLLLLTVLGIFIGAVYLASRFSGSAQENRGSSTAQPVKKFRAKSGTSRENARALVSSVPEAATGVPKNFDPSTTKDVEVWGRLDGSPDTVGPAELSEEFVRIALDGLVAEQSIEQILARLSPLTATAEAAKIYSALGTLYARQYPPDMDNARQAFSLARSHAASSDERYRAAAAEARVLLDQDRVAEAVTTLEKVDIDPSAPATAAESDVMVVLGVAHMRLGEDEKAVELFEGVLDAAIAPGVSPEPEALNVYRQCAIHLARLYRKMGQDRDAEHVRRRVKNWLGGLPN